MEAEDAGWERLVMEMSWVCGCYMMRLPSLVKAKVALLGTGALSRLAVQTMVYSGIPAIKIPTA